MNVRCAVRANLITKYSWDDDEFRVIVDYNLIDTKSDKPITNSTQYNTNFDTTSYPDDSKYLDFVYHAIIDEETGNILQLSTTL